MVLFIDSESIAPIGLSEADGRVGLSPTLCTNSSDVQPLAPITTRVYVSFPASPLIIFGLAGSTTGTDPFVAASPMGKYSAPAVPVPSYQVNV